MLKALWSRRPPQQKAGDESVESIDEFIIIWRRSARRKRSLALRLDRQGSIIVMTPQSITLAELQRFVRSRTAWIRRQQALHQALEERKSEYDERFIWLLGEQLEIKTVHARNNSIDVNAGRLVIAGRNPLKQVTISRRLSSWLRDQAETHLNRRLEVLSEQTGLQPTGLQIKAYTARWGSCRHDGTIQLNWKLIKAPPEVIDYVIVHELSHLGHFNHSPAFWRLVASHCPDYQKHRCWLKEHGQLLISV